MPAPLAVLLVDIGAGPVAQDRDRAVRSGNAFPVAEPGGALALERTAAGPRTDVEFFAAPETGPFEPGAAHR